MNVRRRHCRNFITETLNFASVSKNAVVESIPLNLASILVTIARQ